MRLLASMEIISSGGSALSGMKEVIVRPTCSPAWAAVATATAKARPAHRTLEFTRGDYRRRAGFQRKKSRDLHRFSLDKTPIKIVVGSGVPTPGNLIRYRAGRLPTNRG